MKIIWSKYEKHLIQELTDRCKIKINNYPLDTYIFPTPSDVYETKIPPCGESIELSEEKSRISNFVVNFEKNIYAFGGLYLYIKTLVTDIKAGMRPYIHSDVIWRILVEDFMYSNYIKKLL